MVVRFTFVDGAICHDDMAVCHTGNHAHFVAHQNDGGFLCERLHNGVEMLFEMLVDVAERFVEHQHFRIRNNGASEQSTLQLSARQVADRAILHIGELHQCDGVGKALGIIVGERVKPFPLHARCNHLFHSDGKLAVDKVFLR